MAIARRCLQVSTGEVSRGDIHDWVDVGEDGAVMTSRRVRGTKGGPAIDKTLIEPTVVPDAAVVARCF